MPKAKPEGWKDELVSLVKEGKTYAEAQGALKEKFGDEGKLGVSTYGNLKKEFFPVEQREDALSDIGAQRSKKKKLKATRAPWTSQKQKTADESQLAGVINQVLFVTIPCPSRELAQEDLDVINLGGGVVAVITYIFPKSDLMNNPIIIMIIRIGLLIVKVRNMCYRIKQKIKPEEEEAEQQARNNVVQQLTVHPLDTPEMKKLWEKEQEK